MLLFGIPEEKDRYASGAFDPDGVVQRAMRTVKREMPEMLVIGDVCACEYTDHGHCGILTAARSITTAPSSCWPGSRSARQKRALT